MTSLAELFPEGDHRFHLTLRRGEPAEFFAARDLGGDVLRERKHWLAAEPARYAALQPEGEPLFAEFGRLCASWGGGMPADVIAAGGELEPDFLLLSHDADGKFRLRGGALCFPTGWAIEEKLGHTIDFIHDAVPGLNPAMGGQIHQFLARLKPGVAFLRSNWGLAASAELNLHPARNVRSPTGPVALDRLWLRVEHQALVALPEMSGVLFGIRIALRRLDEATREPAVKAGLARALATMPLELAAYKRLDAIRDELVEALI